MFFETPSPQYWAPAKYRQFDADGKVIEKKFDIQCKRKKASEHTELDKQHQAARLSFDPKPFHGVLSQVLTAWRVQDGDKVKVIDFSLETLDQMEEEFPGFAYACASAFWASVQPSEAAHHIAKN